MRILLAILLTVLTTGTLNASDKVFRMRLVSDPQTFDWNLATTPMETYLLLNIMEGLVAFDPQMKVTPALASSWEISKDQKTYTFKIKKDVLWSDGKKLRAQDFVDSWKRLLDPATAASYAYFLFDIEGAEDFNSRKNTDFSKVGVKAVNDSTLQVTLNRPVGYFLQMLTFWVTFPIRNDIVEANKTTVFGAGNASAWAKPGKMAVVGPFMPVEYQPGQVIKLRRNPKYHGKKPLLDEVQLRIVGEDSTALNLFKTNQLDCVTPVNFLELGELAKTSAYHSQSYFRTVYITFQVSKYPVSLPKVRQAIAMAIDKSKIQKIMQGRKPPADSFVDPGVFPQGKNSALEFNPAKAKALLKEAGIDDVSSLPTLDLLAFSSDDNALITQFLQEELRRNLGVQISISMPEYKTYRTQMNLGVTMMQYRPWGADYADPDTYFSVFLANSGNNMTGWKNAEYDDLVKKAASLQNGEARTKLYQRALEILLREEAVVVPINYDTLSYMLNPKAKGFVINPLNYVYFKDIDIAP